MRKALALDIGGTNTRVAIVDEEGNVSSRLSIPTKRNDKQGLINDILSLIDDTINQHGQEISGIGIGISGPVNPVTGHIYDLPNVGISDLDIKFIIENRYGLPTSIINDANAAGYAEAMIGAGKGYRVVQYVTLSTGIGGGLVYERKLVIGTHGFAQEIGNMVIDPRRKSPNQSMNAGSLEAWCSGRSVVEMANELGFTVTQASDIFTDQRFALLVRDWLRHLGMALGNIVNLYEPDIIVLGGGLMKSAYRYMDQILEHTKPYVYKALRKMVLIVRAKFDQDSGLIGSGLYCLHHSN